MFLKRLHLSRLTPQANRKVDKIRGKRKTHRLPCVRVRAAADSQHSAGEVARSLGAKPNVSDSSGWRDGRSRIIWNFFFFFLIHRTLNALYQRRNLKTSCLCSFKTKAPQSRTLTVHRVEYNCDKNQASLDGLSAFGFQPPLVPSVSTWKCGFYVEMQADPQ